MPENLQIGLVKRKILNKTGRVFSRFFLFFSLGLKLQSPETQGQKPGLLDVSFNPRHVGPGVGRNFSRTPLSSCAKSAKWRPSLLAAGLSTNCCCCRRRSFGTAHGGRTREASRVRCSGASSPACRTKRACEHRRRDLRGGSSANACRAAWPWPRCQGVTKIVLVATQIAKPCRL